MIKKTLNVNFCNTKKYHLFFVLTRVTHLSPVMSSSSTETATLLRESILDENENNCFTIDVTLKDMITPMEGDKRLKKLEKFVRHVMKVLKTSPNSQDLFRNHTMLAINCTKRSQVNIVCWTKNLQENMKTFLLAGCPDKELSRQISVMDNNIKVADINKKVLTFVRLQLRGKLNQAIMLILVDSATASGPSDATQSVVHP